MSEIDQEFEILEYDIDEFGGENNNKKGLKRVFNKINRFRKKKPVKIITNIITSLLMLGIAAFIGIFLAVGTKEGSPVTFAKEYFDYYVNRNWKIMYDMTDMEESKFVNYESFKKVMKEYAIDSNIEDYTFELTDENDKYAYVDVVYTLKKDEALEVEIDENGEAVVDSEDETIDDTEKEHTYSMILKRQDKKILLFYSTWQGFMDNYIVNGCTVEAPESYELKFDGEDIKDCIVGKNEETGDIIYEIGRVFKGEHVITVSSPEFDENDQTVVWEKNLSTYVVPSDQYPIRNDDLKEIKNTTQSIVIAMYNACLNESGIDNVKETVKADEDVYANIDAMYEMMMDNVNMADGTTLLNIAFTDYKYEIKDYEYQKKVTCNFIYKCEYTARRARTMIDGVREKYDGKNTALAKVYFEFKDDKWVPVNIDVSLVDYSVENAEEE